MNKNVNKNLKMNKNVNKNLLSLVTKLLSFDLKLIWKRIIRIKK